MLGINGLGRIGRLAVRRLSYQEGAWVRCALNGQRVAAVG